MSGSEYEQGIGSYSLEATRIVAPVVAKLSSWLIRAILIFSVWHKAPSRPRCRPPSALPPALSHSPPLPFLLQRAHISIFLGAVTASANAGAFSGSQIAKPAGQPRGPGLRANPAGRWPARPKPLGQPRGPGRMRQNASGRWSARASRWDNPAGFERGVAALRREEARSPALRRAAPPQPWSSPLSCRIPRALSARTPAARAPEPRARAAAGSAYSACTWRGRT